MYSLVIFDLDGVLIDTERLNVKYKYEKAKKLGYKLNKVDIKKSLGLGKKEATQYYLDLVKNNELYPILSKYRRDKTKEYVLKYGLPLKPYVIEILSFLKSKNVKIALATSSSYSLLDLYFSQCDVKKYFDVIVSNDDVIHGKPNPEIFLKASQMFNIKSENIIVVEDSINGLKAAKRAGFKTIFIKDQWKMSKSEEIYKDYQFDSLLGLKNLF